MQRGGARAPLTVAGHNGAAGAPDVADFTDVPAGHEFADEVAWLASTGITVGREDGTFGVNDAVTRGAMAALQHRHVEHQRLTATPDGYQR